MILKGMLKWAVGKDDRPINSTKSLKKRRKLQQVDMQRDAQVGLISGCCKHRNNPQGPSRIVHKNRHRVGVINNHHCFNNDPDNGKLCLHDNHDYQVPNQNPLSPSEAPQNNNNNIINSDSKSLLYMSLDHLPMAIVKQYERMLQDAPLKPAPKSVLKSQHVTNCTNNNNSNRLNRPPTSKTKNQKQLISHKKSHSKSITFKDDVNGNQVVKQIQPIPSSQIGESREATATPVLKIKEVSIKEAYNRSLKVLSSTTTPKTLHNDRNKTPSPEVFNEKYPHNLVYPNNTKRVTDFPQSEEKSPELPPKKSKSFPLCDEHLSNSVPRSAFKTKTTNFNATTVTVERNSSIPPKENDENDPNYCPKQKPETSQPTQPTNANPTGPTLPARNPHDTTDPQFLEKPITYSTPPVAKCAKKLTLKRSELKKLERLKTQTERLNRFLKKYYHDCLPNLPEEEEDQCSPEEKSVRLSILRTHWREVKSTQDNFLNGESNFNPNGILHSCYDKIDNVHKTPKNRFPHSKDSKSSNKFNPLLASSFDFTNTSLGSLDECSVRWENMLNASPALISYSNDTGLLPIIQEDSAEVSSSNNSEYQHNNRDIEVARDMQSNIMGIDDTFLMSKMKINADESLVLFLKDSLGLSERRDMMSDNFNTHVEIAYGDGSKLVEEEGGFGMKKLKGLMVEPLGELFDPPASLAEDEGFMSPYPPEVYSPASSSSTFNRFSVSSSGKGSTGEEHENGENFGDEDDYDKDEAEISNLGHTSSQSCSSAEADEVTSEEGGPKYIIMELKHENANYLLVESGNSETWNSHGYLPTSPCGTGSLNSHHSNSSPIPGAERNEHETDQDEEESLQSSISNRLALAFSTPVSKSKSLPQSSLRELRRITKKSTPRKVVRKPPVNSAFSGKGEVLIRTYKNDGDYVTVHVVQARRLQPHSQTSWKLSIKVSLLPEEENTFIRSSETILVGRNRNWVKIDQKFSFEVPSTSSTPKVFLTFVKRLRKKTVFLGWTTLDISNEEKTQCWLKLRKRKMSTATYSMQSSSNHCHSSFMSSSIVSGGQANRNRPVLDSPSPQPVHGMEGSSSSSRCDCEMEPKSGLQNSSTMDSGVEDCCEREPPPPPAPSIDLDDKVGQRVTVRMMKQEGSGYGFSVVWVSPPRIERLEKGKTADVAGLRIGDLIIGVNGEDVTTVPNTTIYTKMKTTGGTLELEIWRMPPPAPQNRTYLQTVTADTTPSSKSSSVATAIENASPVIPNINETRQKRETQQSRCAACLPQNVKNSSTTNSNHVPLLNQIQSQPPPTSILKPPPPAPPTNVNANPPPSQQPPTGSSAWRIRFNIELLDNEDDYLKQFIICELKFFRKIVAALDRYLIPAQSNRLLTPQEINLMFSNVIKIITVTKRILNCVANGSSTSGWKLGGVLLSTHSDHLSEMVSAYSEYAKNLGHSSMILSEKMSLQEFARFVLETPVPKGHLDMTSLLFAPLEHLRNICEICEEISHNNEEWLNLSTQLKECYADIVCDTDFMEPISHVSMKKNPLLSVRDLEKRVVSTSCQPVKVCEKGRRWLFGSRLFKKESDGSWTPVWAFLFTDIIVLTSHTTRDRVFFVKEPAIRLEDVVTLHFNLPRKHENEFRLLFGPEPVHHSRFDKILPIHRNKKSNQIILRTPNLQLKSMWKLLLQRQIITLNTRLSKSASSNFSISEFCERFPITPHSEVEKDDNRLQVGHHSQPDPRNRTIHNANSLPPGLSKTTVPQNTIFDRQNYSDERNLSVIKEEKSYSHGVKAPRYAPDGLSSMTKELLKSRVTRIVPDRRNRVEVIPEEIKVTSKLTNDPIDTTDHQSDMQPTPSPKVQAVAKTNCLKSCKIDEVVTPQHTSSTGKLVEKLVSDPDTNRNGSKCPTANKGDPLSIPVSPSISTSTVTVEINEIKSPLNNNNTEMRDYNLRNKNIQQCPCEVVPEKPARRVTKTDVSATSQTSHRGNDNALPSEKAYSGNLPNYSSVLGNQTPTANHLVSTSDTTTPLPPEAKDRKGQLHKEETKVGNIEPSKTESPRPASRQDEKFQRSNISSPSMSNNRVEALKYEGVGVGGLKSKPGSKIMTNATLKSRQQEVLTPKSQTIITMVDKPDPTKASGTDCILISQQIEHGPVTHKDASSSPLLNSPRCASENGYIKGKPVHTDSPILTGFGSEKSRRRILYDYKIQRDYPELFGITPKDRRSFIKRLAEKPTANDKSLITPYYFSPLPTPKFAKRPDIMAGITSRESRGTAATTVQGSQRVITSNIHGTMHRFNDSKRIEEAPTSSKAIDQNSQKEGQVDSLVETDNDISVKEIARGLLRNVSDEETDEDSDESECQDEVRAQVHRHRSPEESSNDSGISDELTEKSKTTNKENERFQSNVAVNSSEVNICKSNFSAKISKSVVTHQMQLLPKKAHACNSTPNQSNKIDHVYFEGEEETGMETMVVLKADKCTGTDDDYFSHFSRPEKSMRTLMAERREAFFASYQSYQSTSYPSGPSSLKSVPENEPPLIVKIIDGGILHSTVPDPKPISPPEERVQLTRFPEKERNARVERVESSDDSTSSDLASASPAAENGTTDPSWSSSSSSLAGYVSSREEQSTSSAMGNSSNNYNYGAPCPINSQSTSSSSHTKVFMSDFSNGLPNSSFCSFAKGSLLLSNGPSTKPEIVVTQESPETPTVRNGYSSDGEEEDSVLCNGKKDTNSSGSECVKRGFLRVESNDSTVENYGDDDDYNFDDEDDLSQCSVATINRYGTYESLEKIEVEDSVGCLPDFSRPMTRSKARFTFDDEDSDDDNDLFEEDFESDFNFRFPSQIQDNTYSVSRLGPLPPVLEEDFEDDMYDEQRAGSSNSAVGTSSNSANGSTLRARHETGLRHDNSFLLARLATMYARSSISPLKILRDLWLKKRYRQNWRYKE